MIEAPIKKRTPSIPIRTRTKFQRQYYDDFMNSNYSFLLEDGAYIQCFYTFDEQGNLIKQKFGYFECPLNEMIETDNYLDYSRFGGIAGADMGDEEELSKIGEKINEEYISEEFFKESASLTSEEFKKNEAGFEDENFEGKIYFHVDYDPEHYTEVLHPKTHLSIGKNKNCRIPVSSPITVKNFFLFLIKNFYSNRWDDFLEFLKTNKSKFMEKKAEDTISPLERMHFFINVQGKS